MADLETIVTIVMPLTTAAITLLLWGVLVVVQTPHRYWRDALNRSIAGLLITLGVVLFLLALERVGLSHIDPFETRGPIILVGLFALTGLRRTIAELRLAITHERKGH